jgi:hypothetical protein
MNLLFDAPLLHPLCGGVGFLWASQWGGRLPFAYSFFHENDGE